MFLINLQGKESIYEQIKSQIEMFIDVGILKSNDKLPSVRSLAGDLGINPNTVMKAYQELEANGLIYTLNKKGVFVSKDINTDNKHYLEDAKTMINTLKKHGLRYEEVLGVLNEIYKENENVKHKKSK